MIDQNGDIISAEDLDMWGYRMADRSFQSDTTFYKYTGKERDVTTGYDYFGARYYNSRIGRWGGVDPSWEKFLQWSPYKAFMDNPMSFVDPDGRLDMDPEQAKQYSRLASYLKNDIQSITGNKKIMDALIRYSGLSSNEIKDVLKWGEGPIVKISQLEEYVLGQFTTGIGSNTLEISETLAVNLETAEGEDRDVYLFLIGVTILHELTHYGVDTKGIGYSDVRVFKSAEHGEFFERMAYGTVVGNYNIAVDVLNAYNEKKGIKHRYRHQYTTEEIIVTP